MVRTYAYSADFDKKTEALFRNAVFLGEGHNGIVYELPEKKAVKIFQESKCCREEWEILKKVEKSKYFPKLYSNGDYYIVRDVVEGRRLDHYIKDNGLSERLVKNIYYLIKEFKKLKFTKLDARCRDIYVIEDERVRIIDPKECYKRKVNYPRHLMKGLEKINVLEDFIEKVKKVDEKTGIEWEKKIKQYFYNEDLE